MVSRMTQADPWTPLDPLGEVLHLLRMRGAFYCRSDLRAPWALEMPAIEDAVSLHVVLAGHATVEVGDEAVDLAAGDLVLVPHGRGHHIASERGVRPAGRVDQLPQHHLGPHYSLLEYGGVGAPTRLLCAVVGFDDPAAAVVLAALPPVLAASGSAAVAHGWMGETIRLLSAELTELRPGGEEVTTRLADVLVIQALRAFLEQDDAARGGWLGAFRDDRVRMALLAIHRAPERPWTVDALAAEVGASRSAFAARFTEVLGEPPMAYVTRWRMQLAYRQLLVGDATVASVAGRLGYRSEAAFSRAFARVMGTPPGAVRSRAAG
jgi:AraC-like DNA-binding protein